MNFEEQCGATSFAYPSDIAFWGLAKRKVLKIHGTISNYGSIIATRSDYKRVERELRENMIETQLKMLLATKTVVFCGYSLRDDDFLSLFSFVRDQMQGFTRTAYVVTLGESEAELVRLKELGLNPIVADGTNFLKRIKAQLVSEDVMSDDKVYDAVRDFLNEVQDAHVQLYDELDVFKFPQIVLCASYQDGLMDGLRRMLRQRSHGEYSDPTRPVGTALGYEQWKSLKLKAKRYDDVAYIEGYQRALYYLHTVGHHIKPEKPPLYWTIGLGPINAFGTYKRRLRDMQLKHKASYEYARKFVSKFVNHEGAGVVFHHKCNIW